MEAEDTSEAVATLAAIVSLDHQKAAALLEAANFDLNTAVHLHFEQTQPPPDQTQEPQQEQPPLHQQTHTQQQHTTHPHQQLSLLQFLQNFPGLSILRQIAVGIGRFIFSTPLLDILQYLGSWILAAPLRALGILPALASAADTAGQFHAEFERDYGETHPVFFRGSCSQALQRAKREGKFLLVYVHGASSSGTPMFLTSILNSALFAAYTDENFIFWVADVATLDGRAVLRALPVRTSPVLALLVLGARQEGAAQLLGCVPGIGITDEQTVSRLQALAGQWEHLLEASRNEARERENDRLLREEQESEYARALAEDQAREAVEREAAELEARRAQEAADAAERQARLEREEIEAFERRQEERRKKGKQLPAEPGDGTCIVVKLPDGQRLKRFFDKESKLQIVVDWIESCSLDIYEFDLVSNFPRKQLTVDDRRKTLEELGLHPASTLFTKEQEEEAGDS